GIRDKLVTGVQTCALPILAVVFTIFFFFAAGLWDLAFALGFDLVMAFLRLATYRRRKQRLTPNGRSPDLAFGGPADGDLRPSFRSEERRVGKECRSRCRRE